MALVPIPSPYVRARRERRREEILRAALRAFRRHGYHATTLEDIARRLGVRKTALYHYFPDKEEILYQCHRESLAELDRIVNESRRGKDPRDRLRHVIREHVRVMTDVLEGSPLAFEVTALSPRRRSEIIGARDRYECAIREIIEQGIRDRLFRAADAKVATFAILGAINWIARWYRPEGDLDAEALGNQFAEHLLSGLGAPGAACPAPGESGARAPREGARG